MKKIPFLVFVLVSLLAGCSASVRTSLLPGSISDCESGDAEQDKACYRDRAAQARELLAAKPEQKVAEEIAQEIAEENLVRLSENPPADQPPRSNVPMEYVLRVAASVPSEGCNNAHNVSFINKSNDYIEVPYSSASRLLPCSDKLTPCGTGGLVLKYVQTGNGSGRWACLIPPGGYGWFYTMMNGTVPYTIVAYDPSTFTGWSDQSPKQATGGVYRNDLRFPAEGNWYRVQINQQDVRPPS